jgi:hypothetical protein
MTNSKTRIYTALLFAFIWVATYNVAFLNGDDVVHMIGRHYKDFYFPMLETDWIPTRAIDPYLRGIFVRVMDLLFFPLKDAFGLDFFHFYKLFNATIFTGFIGLIYFYFNSLIASKGDLDGENSKTAPPFLSLILLIVGLVFLFPWKNQVHLIAYYLPGVLCFILLSQIGIWGGQLRAGRASDDLTVALLATLAYVCVFSHEAYALVVGMTIALYLIINYFSYGKSAFLTQLKASKTFRFYVISMLLFIAFALISTLIFWKFSMRISISAKGQFSLHGVYVLIAKSKYELVIYFIACMGYLLEFTKQFNFKARLFRRFISYDLDVKKESRALSIMGFSAIFSSVVIAFVISVLTGANYLSHQPYPWGGIMIVADLFSLILLIFVIRRIYDLSVYIKSLILLLIFVVFTKIIYLELSYIDLESKKSRAVQLAYQSYVYSNIPLIETGLNLAAVPSQVKALPDETIPSEFLLAYSVLFKKYYGVNRVATFK